MNTKIIFIGVVLSLLGWGIHSLEAKPKPRQEAEEAKPLELPNFVIERVEELNINIGTKQKPIQPKPISTDYLDSINSFEKQTVIPVAPENFTNVVYDNSFKHGYLQADFGRFTTANFAGGYGANISGYELFANAGLDISKGHMNGADFWKSSAQISSDYIAPMKFFIFGGSRTRTSLKFDGQSYNLYGSESDDFIQNRDYHRTGLNFDVNIHSDGNYRDVQFQTGAGFNTLQLVNDVENISNNSLVAYLKVQKYWKHFFVGLNTDLNINTLEGDNCSYNQIDLSAKYLNNKISIAGNVGLQHGATNVEDNRVGLMIAGKVEFRANHLFTVFGDVRSGLNKSNFLDYYRSNPYLNLNTQLDYSYDVANANLGLIIHPSVRTGVSASIGYRSTKRFAYFMDDINQMGEFDGTFSLLYGDISGLNLQAETWLYLTPKDKFIANIESNFYSLSDAENIPYLPTLQATVNYNRKLIPKLNAGIGIIFASNRYGDIANEIEVGSYIDLRLNAEYRISDKFKFYINGENLFNQNVFLYNNYKSWGLFLKGGILWQFG